MMRVLRILGRISDETLGKLKDGKSPPDSSTDFFYFVDYSAFDFKLGEHMCAVYKPDGKLLIEADIELTYITQGWGDSQNGIYKGAHFGCGFIFCDKSYEAINNFLPTTKHKEWTPNRYLYFLGNQDSIPKTLPLELLGYTSS